MRYSGVIFPGIYRHYKNNLYKVSGIARHTETSECFVVYRSIYDRKRNWIRPLSSFCEEVYVDGIRVPRFTLVTKLRNTDIEDD